MNKIIETAKDLIAFKSVKGNDDEIRKCLNYIKDFFKDKKVFIREFNEKVAPVLVISNVEGDDFDAMTLGHIDVVPANDEQFNAKIKGDNFIGRGTLDMKTWAALGMENLNYVIDENLPVKFAIVITTDEETDATGAEYIAKNTNINAGVLLDVDVGGDITEIITKGKNAMFIELNAKGISVHGASPWKGEDANERLMKTIMNLRKTFPYYSKSENVPNDTWVDTMHIGTFKGGSAGNIISESASAELDFRLTEKMQKEKFIEILENALEEGVSYKIKMEGMQVVIDEKSPYLKAYKEIAEDVIGENVDFISVGGTTDSRHFSKNSTVIMHSGSGDGMHGIDEYASVKSINQMEKIQKKFLKKLKDI